MLAPSPRSKCWWLATARQKGAVDYIEVLYVYARRHPYRDETRGHGGLTTGSPPTRWGPQVLNTLLRATHGRCSYQGYRSSPPLLENLKGRLDYRRKLLVHLTGRGRVTHADSTTPAKPREFRLPIRYSSFSQAKGWRRRQDPPSISAPTRAVRVSPSPPADSASPAPTVSCTLVYPPPEPEASFIQPSKTSFGTSPELAAVIFLSLSRT